MASLLLSRFYGTIRRRKTRRGPVGRYIYLAWLLGVPAVVVTTVVFMVFH